MKLTASMLALGVASAAASADEMSMVAKIKARLQSGGATNCDYKCANLWDINSLWDSANGNAAVNAMSQGSVSILNEYIGCVAGCQSCNGGTNAQCMGECKNRNWFTTNWWYNPYTGGLGFLDGCATDLVKQQKECIDKIPLPSTGGRAVLKRSYTDATQKCFDDPVYGIVAINAMCNGDFRNGPTPIDGECRAKATCTVYTSVTQTCTTKDVAKQYTADMCGSGVLKNVIEPDKACMVGCITNLCQTGAQCLGQGVWSSKNGEVNCQVITPQTTGMKYTIIPSIFESPQSDLAGCCSQSRVCCGYLEAWASTRATKRQRKGVCTVANSKENCADPQTAAAGFNINAFGKDISKGPYPGNGCNELWQPNGICESQGFEPCPNCRI